MEEVILKAVERVEKTRKVREGGFIPGVLYGEGAGATSVKFEASALRKILIKYGWNAKVWVELNDTKKFGFIKEVQKHPVEGNVIHIDVQLVSKDQEIKLQIPISFSGIEELEHRMHLLQVYKSEVEVVGKTALMPNVIVVDVSNKNAGDTITFQDFGLDPELKNNEGEFEVYAVIKEKQAEPAAETEEDTEEKDVE